MTDREPHVSENRIEAWLDGELPTSESSALNGHIQRCPACRDLVERAQALRSILDVDAKADADVRIRPMWPLVRDRLHKNQNGRVGAIFRPAFTLATSVATVAGIVAGLLLGSIDGANDVAEEESLWSTLESTLWETEEGTSFSDIYEISDGIEGEEGS